MHALLFALINEKLVKGQYRCNKCDVMLNSEAQLMQHLGSLRHQSGGTNESVKSHQSTSSITDPSPNQSPPNESHASPNHHSTQREFDSDKDFTSSSNKDIKL